MNPTVLETRRLAIGYPARGGSPRVVASDVSASLHRGELVCLLGPNGAGKSTLIRTIAGMLHPLAGGVLLGGEDVHGMGARRLAQRLSVVLTDRVQAGALSAYSLVALGRHPYTDWSGRLTEHDEQRVQWAMRAVGAEGLAARGVLELSDGERQKVMIARALAQEPRVMALDEPTAFLDLPRRVEVMHLLQRLAHDAGRAVLLSTHDLDLALRCADRLWLLPTGGPLQSGAPEDLVLSGAFERAFAGAGVRFDESSGAFHIDEERTCVIQLVGAGAAARWTRRALERAGFIVGSGEASVRCIVEERGEDGGVSWRVEDGAGSTEGRTLGDLVALGREILKQRRLF